MAIGLWQYLKAAFSARPAGMFVPPNWIGVGLFALLGFVNSGFWLLGAGLELAYLVWLSTNPRFQRVVNGEHLVGARLEWQARLEQLVSTLARPQWLRYRAMEDRCQAILQLQRGAEINPGARTESEGLARLLWIFLRLLLTRQTIDGVLNDADSDSDRELDRQLSEQEDALKKTTLTDDLRKSIQGQVDILRQRIDKRREAHEKLSFLDSELSRIEQQAELLREQAVLVTDPEVVSQRIDQVTATLGGTSQWIREQQQMYGQVEDLLAEPPPVTLEPTEKEKR